MKIELFAIDADGYEAARSASCGAGRFAPAVYQLVLADGDIGLAGQGPEDGGTWAWIGAGGTSLASTDYNGPEPLAVSEAV